MSDILFYAIRQRSTGAFLPHHFGERSGPYTADESTAGAFPRPFKTAAAARVALSAWLKRPWTMTACHDEGEPPEYFPEPPRHPPANRLAADMEVVEVRLGSVRPVL